MAALSNCFKSHSGKDITANFKIYEATPSLATTADATTVSTAPGSVAEQQDSCPLLSNKSDRDEAAVLLPPA